MGVNTLNSLADPICPTYGSGFISIISSTLTQPNVVTTGDRLNDSASPGSPNGYINNFSDFSSEVGRAGSFNNGWTNGCHSQNVAPTYSNGILSFGNTGRQS